MLQMGGDVDVRSARALVTAAVLALTGLTTTVPAIGGVFAPAVSRPAHNVAADPAFMAVCADDGGDSDACISDTVLAIEHARSLEPMRQYSLVLPNDFQQLTRAQQVFVIIDLERVDRGLRPLQGMVPSLDSAAQAAAAENVDPSPAIVLLRASGVRVYRTVWSRSFGVLASDYGWMYADGYSAQGNVNVGCRSAGAPGCWDHRRGILTPFDGLPLLLAGTGAATGSRGMDSVAAILTGGTGPTPHFSYTWQDALDHGADAV